MRFLIFGDIITLIYCLGNYTYKAIQIILEVGGITFCATLMKLTIVDPL